MKFLVVFCFVFLVSFVECSRYIGDQVWSFIPKNQDQLNFVKALTSHHDLDVWKTPTNVGKQVDFRVLANSVTSLQQLMTSNGMTYKVKIEDVQVLVENERKSRVEKSSNVKSLSSFDYSVYHNAQEIYEWMDLVTSEYSFVTKVQVGVTFEGRPIYLLEIKKNSFPSKKAIYIDALIHCREWISGATTMFTFHQILTNSDLQWMLDAFDWIFVPMINIDGYVHTWENDRLWRKTRSTTATSGCTGVDGNRNWDFQWSVSGASERPCASNYYGPLPHSESEVRHLANYIMEKSDSIKAALTIHSYTQYVLFPYSYAQGVYTSNYDELYALAGNMSEAIYEVHQKTFIYGHDADTFLYEAGGVTHDWLYAVAGIELSFLFELRDTGEFGFILPPDQIIPSGEEFLAAIQTLVAMVTEQEGSG